jgi:hypothetical protein
VEVTQVAFIDAVVQRGGHGHRPDRLAQVVVWRGPRIAGVTFRATRLTTRE